MRIKTKCKGKYRNGEKCVKDAMIKGYCIAHLPDNNVINSNDNLREIILVAYQMGVDNSSKKVIDKYIEGVNDEYEFRKK